MSLAASILDQDRDRIKDDLRGVIKGDVLADDVSLQLYATDASIYEIKPLVVVRPRGVNDVVSCVQYAAENNLPLYPRGAGTGLAGESLGAGIVVDFSRYMRRLIAADSETICLQPGAVHAQVNEYLRAMGRQFGPDPAMSSVTTFGSMIAIDASGSHRLKYGSTRDHVRSLQLVLADGQVIEAEKELLTANGDAPSPKRRLVDDLASLLIQRMPLIEQYQPLDRVNRCGYQLGDVLHGESLDLARLVSGSEGTLALITEATLDIQQLPKHRGVALLFFDRLESAARAVMEVLPFNPSACDLMDRRHLSLAREHTVHYDLLIPAATEAALLVEYEGDSLLEVRDRLSAINDRIRRKKRLAFHAIHAQDRLEVELYWRLARKVVPTLHRLKGATRPLPFIEDLAVPPRVLPDFLVRMQNVLKAHQVTASLFGHAGHGQLHLRPFLDLSNPDDVARMAQLAADLYQEVIESGGTISGEHATGLSRTSFLRQQYGPLVDVFGEVKQIFDPRGGLNPGKIVSDDPNLLTSNLRPTVLSPAISASVSEPTVTDGNGAASPPASPPIKLQLAWTIEDVNVEVRNCNGCGACRSQLSDVRMCPIFRYAGTEEATPRAKANLMRGILTGALDPATLSKDEFKSVADLCVHCHMCRLECPASVDIPRLMAEGKGAYVRVNGLPLSEYVMSRIDTVSSLASLVRPLSNWALGNRYARWFLEKSVGLAQGRRLPRLAPRTFQRIAARRRLNRASRRSGQKVLYFVDTYANYYDPQLGEALVAVLEHNAVSVFVHPAQVSSAMPMIALGAVGKAKQLAAQNVALLAEAVRMGYHIVATEPSAALCLKHEYVQLLGDDDARLVAANSSEACTYLWKLHQIGKLQLDFRPINATLGYHQPCHLRTLEVGSPGESLLRLIPGLVVSKVSGGCSGMAGTFGLQKKNYRASLRAGRELIANLRSPRLQAGTTECSTCKMQMEHGTEKPTIHPLKLMAHSYGLMPKVASLLGGRPGEMRIR